MTPRTCPLCGYRYGHADECPFRREIAIERLSSWERVAYAVAIGGWFGVAVAILASSG